MHTVILRRCSCGNSLLRFFIRLPLFDLSQLQFIAFGERGEKRSHHSLNHMITCLTRTSTSLMRRAYCCLDLEHETRHKLVGEMNLKKEREKRDAYCKRKLFIGSVQPQHIDISTATVCVMHIAFLSLFCHLFYGFSKTDPHKKRTLLLFWNVSDVSAFQIWQ